MPQRTMFPSTSVVGIGENEFGAALKQFQYQNVIFLQILRMNCNGLVTVKSVTWLTNTSPTTSRTSDRAGDFSGVTAGGRCLFTVYLWGKPLAPSVCEGNSGRGQNSPVDKA